MSEYLVESDEYLVELDDIIALSPDDSIQAHNFIGSLSDEDLASIEQEELPANLEMLVETFGEGNTCTKCGLQLPNAIRLSKHMRDKHATSFSEICFICKKTFGDRRALRRHRIMHQTTAEYPCTACDKKFKYKTSLNLHMRKHKEDRKYVCTICSRAFFTKAELEAHKSVHVSEKTFKCHCGKAFKSQHLLRVHLPRHTEETEKKFACDLCEKKFITNAELQIHGRSHSVAKPYACDKCKKSFKSENYLSFHKRGHSDNAKRYTCTICPKDFKQLSVFKNHMIKVHQKKKNQ